MRSFIGFVINLLCLVGFLAGVAGLLTATVAVQVYGQLEGMVGISRLALALASVASLIASLVVAAWRSNNWPEGQTIESRDAQASWAVIALVAGGALAASSLRSEELTWALGGFAAFLVLLMARAKGNRLVRANELRLKDAPVRYSQRWVAWINWAFSWLGNLKPEPFMPIAMIVLALAGWGTLLAVLAQEAVGMSFLETALAALVASLLTFVWCLGIYKRANLWDDRDYRAFTVVREEASSRLVPVGRGRAPTYDEELVEPDMTTGGGRR